MYTVLCVCDVAVQTKVKPLWWVTFAPLLTLVSSVWSPFFYIYNMQPLSSLTVSVSFCLSCFSHSTVLFLSVCGAALPVSSRPACPIDWWRREENSFMALQGLFQMERPSLSSCVFSEKSRASGGLTISWASSLIKTLLFLLPPSPSFSWSLECARRLQELQVADGGRS